MWMWLTGSLLPSLKCIIKQTPPVSFSAPKRMQTRRENRKKGEKRIKSSNTALRQKVCSAAHSCPAHLLYLVRGWLNNPPGYRNRGRWREAAVPSRNSERHRTCEARYGQPQESDGTRNFRARLCCAKASLDDSELRWMRPEFDI